MNAQNIINAAVATLIENHYWDERFRPIPNRSAWDDGEAEAWLIKIAQGLKLSYTVDADNNTYSPCLVA